MEFRRPIRSNWLRKVAICLVFAIFMVAKVEAGLVVPTITAQPSNTSVQNGDTTTFSMSAGCLLSAIPSVVWYCNNKPVYTNSYLLTLFSVSSTLTLNHVSTNNAGSYYAVVSDLLGGSVKTATATLSITPPVAAVAGGSGMITKGFKLQFSGPTGSNLVIEATADMVHWTSISTNLLTGGSVTYTDTIAKTVTSRFYRARLK